MTLVSEATRVLQKTATDADATRCRLRDLSLLRISERNSCDILNVSERARTAQISEGRSAPELTGAAVSCRK